MYSFPDLEPVCCSMSGSNCCFLTCIQISQEAGQGVWYSHRFQNFPQFVVIHAIKGFGVVNKAEIDFFWNSLAFLMIQWMLAIWSLLPLPFTPERKKRQSKAKTTPVVDVNGDGNKVRSCKEQYCSGPGMLGSWIRGNWKWSNRRWQEWTLTFEESVN